MPALAERTKIKTGSANIPATTGLIFYGGGFPPPYAYPSEWSYEDAMEANLYLIASASTKIQIQQYIPSLSAKAKDMLRKIYQFKSLPENWDGNGGIPPNDQVVNNSIDFLTTADEYDLPIYFTAPGPNGEIVLEYKAGNIAAEVYFEDNATEMILYNQKEQQYIGEISIPKLLNHFRTTVIVHGC